MVTSVTANGPGAKAGLEPGDVILELNGKPVAGRNALVQMVMATKPGTTVPMKVLRDKAEKSLSVTVEELNLETEGGGAQRGSAAGGSRQRVRHHARARWGPRWRDACACPSGTRGVLITEVDPMSAAAREGVRPGDVILKVNGQAVETVRDVSQALQAIRPGGAARMLLWKRRPGDLRGRDEGVTRLRPAPMDSDCRALIVERIRQRGPITVAEFMDLALYAPEVGYYARAAQRSGRTGDFFTSVDIGPRLRRAARGALRRRVWRDLRRRRCRRRTAARRSRRGGRRQRPPLPRHPRRRGPAAPGLLSRHRGAPRRTQRRGPRGPPRDARRARSVASRTPATRCRAASTASCSPTNCWTRFPFTSSRWDEAGLLEVYVDLEAGRLVDRLGPLSSPALAEYLADAGVTPRARARVRRSISRPSTGSPTPRARLRRGFLVLIDYGYEARGAVLGGPRQGTLATFHRHLIDAPAGSAPRPARPGWPTQAAAT